MEGSSALPSTRYAKSGNVHVAYQIFGDGGIDLVFFPDFVSNIETYWEEPSFAHWLNKLASFARVITFDKRGTGLSDRVESLPTMDERMDDVRAVMDAAGSQKAAVFGLSEGGSLATLFAAHYPERCRALVLWGENPSPIASIAQPNTKLLVILIAAAPTQRAASAHG